MRIDWRDLAVVAGVALMGWSLWHLSVWLFIGFIGLLLVLLALFFDPPGRRRGG